MSSLPPSSPSPFLLSSLLHFLFLSDPLIDEFGLLLSALPSLYSKNATDDEKSADIKLIEGEGSGLYGVVRMIIESPLMVDEEEGMAFVLHSHKMGIAFWAIPLLADVAKKSFRKMKHMIKFHEILNVLSEFPSNQNISPSPSPSSLPSPLFISPFNFPPSLFLFLSHLLLSTRTLLLVNADDYSAWNMRKQILIFVTKLIENNGVKREYYQNWYHSECQKCCEYRLDHLMEKCHIEFPLSLSSSSSSPLSSLCSLHSFPLFSYSFHEEIQFINLVFSKHPKSGEAWAHRRYIMTMWANEGMREVSDSVQRNDKNRNILNAPWSEEERAKILHSELSVCDSAARLYNRNYYSWTHRIFVMERIGNQKDIESDLMGNVREWCDNNPNDHSAISYRQWAIIRMSQIFTPSPSPSSSPPSHYPCLFRHILSVTSSSSSSSSPPSLPSDLSPTLLSSLFSSTFITRLMELNGININPSSSSSSSVRDKMDISSLSQSLSPCSYCEMVSHEVNFLNTLMDDYRGHESLWIHRRFLFIIQNILHFQHLLMEINKQNDLLSLPSLSFSLCDFLQLPHNDTEMEYADEVLSDRQQSNYSQQCQYASAYKLFCAEVGVQIQFLVGGKHGNSSLPPATILSLVSSLSSADILYYRPLLESAKKYGKSLSSKRLDSFPTSSLQPVNFLKKPNGINSNNSHEYHQHHDKDTNISISSSPSPTPPLSLSLISDIKNYLICHSLLIDSPLHGISSPGVSIFPSPFPKIKFHFLQSLCQTFSTLYNHVANMANILSESLTPLLRNDHFINKLYHIYRECEEFNNQNPYNREPFSLQINRSDYMVNKRPKGNPQDNDNSFEYHPYQVEFNTISCGLGVLSSKISSLHQYVKSRYPQEFSLKIQQDAAIYPQIHSNPNSKMSIENISLPPSNVGEKISKAMGNIHSLWIKRWKGKEMSDRVHSNPLLRSENPNPHLTPCILFVIQSSEWNIVDQDTMKYEIFNSFGVIVHRVTLSQIFTHCVLQKSVVSHQNGKESITSFLIYDSQWVVTMCYFRSAYSPVEFPDTNEGENYFSALKRVEMSNCVKIPSISYHLSGMKKIQFDLRNNPKIIQNAKDQGIFNENNNNNNNDNICRDLQSVMAEMLILEDPPSSSPSSPSSLSMSSSHSSILSPPSLSLSSVLSLTSRVLSSPSDWILKSQREGGGNTKCGNELITIINQWKHKWEGKDRELASLSFGDLLLMKKLSPPSYPIFGIKNSEVIRFDGVIELGLFGLHCSSHHFDEKSLTFSTRVLQNECVGSLVRTKQVDMQEGGIAKGYGVLDSIYLYGEEEGE